MSTPAIISFKQKGSSETVNIYRHWDGYPDAVIPALYKAWDTLNKTHSHRDLSYVAADVLFLWKLEDFIQEYPFTDKFREWLNSREQPGFLLGYGIVPQGSYWDADYFYEVTVPRTELSVTGGMWMVVVRDSHGNVLYSGELLEEYDAD